MVRRAFASLALVETLLAFGNTFAASFNMIYLFKHLDMPLWSGSIYLVLGFTISIFASLWMSWRPRFDLSKAIIFSLAALCVEYLLFLFVDNGYVLAVSVGVAFGLFYPFFWTPTNIWMAQLTDKGDRGVKYGVIFFLWPLATFVAPFLGGLVIGYVGYTALYVVGIGILISTAAVAFLTRDVIPVRQEMKINLREIGRRNTVAVLGQGAFEGVFWLDLTIISFVFLTDERELGALFSLFGLSAGVMGIILGKVSDRIQNRIFFFRASALASIPCIFLIFRAGTLEEFGIASGMLEFASYALPVFIFAMLTDRLEHSKNDSVLTREFLLDIGRAVSGTALIAMLYIGFSPQECFLMAIPGLLLTLVAEEPKRKRASAAG
jgi:MFS family permease